MLSKLLIRLIDKAIIPSLLLLSSRVASIVLVAKYLGIGFKINRSGFIFQSSTDYVKVNSYSALIMTGMLVIGLGYVIIKSLFFHDSHIKPTITARLFSIKAESLIQNSYEIYTQGAVWLMYAYLLLIVSTIMSLSGLMFNWVFYIILGTTLLTTLIFILDLEEEVKIKKEMKEKYDDDKKYLDQTGELE